MRVRREGKRTKDERGILCFMEGQLKTWDKLQIACGRRAFFVSFFSAMVFKNGVDAIRRSAPNVNVMRNSNKRGQAAGVTITVSKVAKCLHVCSECGSDGKSHEH